MKNPLYVPGLKPGIHRIGQGSVRKVRIRDIVSTQALVDESKIKKLARFTKNMPGTPTLSHRGRGKYSILDGNHRVNAAIRQGKRTIEALVQKFSSKQPIIHFISCTTESVPRVDLSRRIVKRKNSLRRLSSRLDELIAMYRHGSGCDLSFDSVGRLANGFRQHESPRTGGMPLSGDTPCGVV